MTHPVVFIGAGPGEADLITVRGAKRLAEAEVVLFDALADPALRVHAPQAEWIDVGKRGFSSSAMSPAPSTQPCPAGEPTAQDRINALLVQHARRGVRVVRLKGGDPSVFGRLEEELEALSAAGLRAEIVPGVTAAVAAAALTQRPLTRRGGGRSVSLATAMTRTLDLHVLHSHAGSKPSGDTEVYYMAGRQLAAMAAQLVQAGWQADAPCCVTSHAGWPDARSSEHSVATLGQAAALHAGRPTIVVVGAGALPIAAAVAPAIEPAAVVPKPAP